MFGVSSNRTGDGKEQCEGLGVEKLGTVGGDYIGDFGSKQTLVEPSLVEKGPVVPGRSGL